MRRADSLFTLAATLCLAFPACGATPEAVARTRAANDFSCPEDKVTVDKIAGTSYQVEGCGDSAVYDCAGSVAGRGGTSDYVCIREESQASSPSARARGAADEATSERVEGIPEVSEECRAAYKHIDELTAAWHEWYPDRAAKESPSRMDFLGVCRRLPPEQQLCLTMPYGRTHRKSCAPLFETLEPPHRARLDALFFAAP